MRAWLAPALALLAVTFACARARNDQGAAIPGSRIDPALRRLVEAHPDSVVGVFLRLTRPVGDAERAVLERAGVRPGTSVGDLLSGRARARDVPAVASLDFVRYIQLARQLRPQVPQRPRAPYPLGPDGIA